MKKLLLLMCALLAGGVSGAWAADYYTVTVCNNTSYPNTLGTFSNQATNYGTWTSTAFVGANSLTITSEEKVLNQNYWSTYKYCFTINGGNNNTYTINLSVPDGYKIARYSLGTMKTTTNQKNTKVTVTSEGGASTGEFNTGGKTLDVTDVNKQSTYFTVKTSSTDASVVLAIATMSVVVVPAEVADAASTIKDGRWYRIFTKNNGSSEGETKYYLNSTGYLTSDEASAATFLVSTTTTDQYIPKGCAFKFTSNSQTGNRFTNRPNTSPSPAVFINTSANTRDDYESQVLYKNGSNKYAIRSTNYNGSGLTYYQNSYWTVIADQTSDGIPEASYDETEGTKHYVWQLEELEIVTYDFMYGGDKIGTTVLPKVLGDPTQALSTWKNEWNNPYCTYAYSPATVAAGTETVTATLTWDKTPPFEFSSDYASATWYNLSMRTDGDRGWAVYSSETSPYPLITGSGNKKTAASNGAASLWAFIGNPLGVRVINRAAGNGKYLGSYNTDTNPTMGETADEHSLWNIGKNNSGFTLHVGNKYLYDRSRYHKLAILNNAAAGNPGEDGAALNATRDNFVYYAQALADIDEFAASHAVGEYFGLKISSYTSQRDLIATAAGVSGDGISESIYTDNITPAIEALWPGTGNANVRLPETGNYLVRNNYTTNYLKASTDRFITSANVEASAIVHLTDNNDGTYNLALQGKYIGEAPKNLSSYAPHSDSPYNYAWEISSVPGCVCLQEGTTGTYLWCAGTVTGWVGNNSGSKWSVEDIEGTLSITLNSGGDSYYYATFCAPFSYTVTGATAYTLALSGDKSYLVPTPIDGEVTAGTPVLLKGTSASAALTIGTGYAATPLTTTALEGTYLSKDVSGINSSAYFLGLAGDPEEIGFYHWAGSTLGANRAYLPASALSVKGVLINWDAVDGIESIGGELSTKDDAIYNLAGQRMSRVQKGVNIVNGKKVLVK